MIFLWRTLSRRSLLPALVLLGLSLSACTPGTAIQQGAPAPELQWPPLPLPPRIVWVQAIGSPHDLGITKGFWKRLSEFFAGAVDERIGRPYGMFVDDHDRLFIVDVNFSFIHVMDMKNKRYATIGAGGDRKFRSPIGVTGDGDETIYVTDSGAGVVYRYSLKAQSLEPFIRLAQGRPTGIAFNRQDRLLYVTDTAAHQVVVFDSAGAERFRLGTRGEAEGEFNYPTDIFFDNRGRQLYVTDAMNARIQTFSPEGAFLRAFGRPGDAAGSFARPKGVAVDSEGHIYVSDAMSDMVQIYDDSGGLLLTFGSNGSEAGQFWMPSGIFIDADDRVYVADSFNRRVQVFRYLRLDAAPAAPSARDK